MSDEVVYIGEVIESSTLEFSAESRELHSPPPFGSFVKVLQNGQPGAPVLPPAPEDEEADPFDSFRTSAGAFGSRYRELVEGEDAPERVEELQPAIYAVVYQAATGPTDSGRRPRAYWKDEEQLQEEQPELSEWLLMTRFDAAIIGYSNAGMVHQFLPPQPPKMHRRVYPCTPDEVRLITSRLGFLRTLANSRAIPGEEIIAACIREACAHRSDGFDFLVAAGKELASVFKDDYDRLQAIMRRVSP